MARETLKLQGIQRNRKRRKFDPGSANELVNLRFHDGVWEAVGDKVVKRKVYGLNIKKMLTYHTIGSVGNFIYLTTSGQIRSDTGSINGGGQSTAESNATLISGLDAEQEYRAETLNNVLVILSQDRMYHFVWKDGEYIDGISSFPDFAIKRVINDVEVDWALTRDNYYDLGNSRIISEFLGDGSAAQDVDFTSALASRVVGGVIPDFETLLASLQSRKNLAQENGIPVGPVYMCATIELFDGSEVQHTPPIKTAFGELVVAKRTVTYDTTDVFVRISEYHGVSVPEPEKLEFKFSIKGITDKTLVKRVHFYITRPPAVFSEYWDESMSFVKPIVKPWGVYHRGGPNLWRAYQPIYVTEGLTKHQFYRVGSADVEDLQTDGVVSVKFDNVNNLELYETLPIDNYTHHSITSKSIAQYNGRVILANTTTKLKKPEKFSNMGLRTGHKPVSIGGSQAVIDWYLQRIQIQDSSDEQDNPDWPFIVKSWEDSMMHRGGHMIQGYLQPDGGATAYSLGYFSGSTSGAGSWRQYNQYKVKAEVFYRVWIKGEAGNIVTTSETEVIENFTMGWDPYGAKWHLMFVLDGTVTYPDVRASRMEVYIKGVSWQHVGVGMEISFPPNSKPFWRISKAMVPSELNNFASCSLNESMRFTVSNANAPAADPPPLIHDVNRVQASALNNPFVFPAINSYRVGASEVLGLQTINNAISEGQFGEYPVIAFTRSGVWAMTIAEGERLISSIVPLANEICTNPDSITAVRKGIAFVTAEGLKIISGSNTVNISEIVRGNPATRLKDGAVMQKILDSSGYSHLIADVDFDDYIQGAQIGYDDYYEELIISNPAKHYSYLFNLETNTWYCASVRFDGFLAKFPYLFGFDGRDVYATNKEDRQPKNVLYISNEINFANVYSKFEQMLARGRFGRCRAMVFGTTDLENWKLLSIVTTPGGFDMRLPRGFYTCKSFVIVLDGTFEPDSYLEDFDVETKHRYGRRFR